MASDYSSLIRITLLSLHRHCLLIRSSSSDSQLQNQISISDQVVANPFGFMKAKLVLLGSHELSLSGIDRYPNDSEKLMLASQTGLSKNQVSNWFINARVRLWKPMIEDMYKEEFADNDSADSDPMLASSSLHGDARRVKFQGKD
ncbi:hypothetical protein Vadar_025002 [Vaccinium darrowii]|uniref:Uncharacterized protein n=1 Tax=Vaccinium darrowii TaxID=229202 RepID=A0ACB7Y1Q2_9ERIC|nr:hypothetical protein Vadar_025002 [Vaccinium darrowii]